MNQLILRERVEKIVPKCVLSLFWAVPIEMKSEGQNVEKRMLKKLISYNGSKSALKENLQS